MPLGGDKFREKKDEGGQGYVQAWTAVTHAVDWKRRNLLDFEMN